MAFGVAVCGGGQTSFHFAVRQDLKRAGIQAVDEVLIGSVGVGVGEQIIIEADLGVHRRGGIHPMNRCTLDLPAIGGVAAPALRVILGSNLGHIAVFVRFVANALDQIRALQAALRAVGGQTLVLGDRLSHKVIGLDPQTAREGYLTGTGGGVQRIVLHGDGLRLTSGIVGNGQLDGPQNGHHPLGGLVQILPEAVLQEAVFHHVGRLGHADAVTEITDGPGGVAPAAQAAEGGHPGIVPAGDPAFLHQLAELALAHDRVVDAKAGKLDLPGMGRQVAMLDDPVVQGTVGLKFQRAQAVGNALQRVLNGMGEVIHGIDAPLVPLTVMVHVVDPVDNGVPHIEVAAGQVDLGPQGHGTVGELPCPHPGKEVQALLHGTVPVGRRGRNADVSPVCTELLGRQLAHIGKALFDEAHSLLVILLKIVGAVEEAVTPVETKPVDVLLDGLHELLVLFGGVGVIHPQVAQSAKLLSGTEVDGQGLAVADMQIAVGLRRKPGMDGHAFKLSALGNILLNKRVDEIAAFGGLRRRGLDLVSHCCQSFLKKSIINWHYTEAMEKMQGKSGVFSRNVEKSGGSCQFASSRGPGRNSSPAAVMVRLPAESSVSRA